MSRSDYTHIGLSHTALIRWGDEDQDDQLLQERARQYAAYRPYVNLEDFVAEACSHLPAMIPVIAMAQEVLEHPPDPDDPRAHVQDLIRVGQAVLNALTAEAEAQIRHAARTHGED